MSTYKTVWKTIIQKRKIKGQSVSNTQGHVRFKTLGYVSEAF